MTFHIIKYNEPGIVPVMKIVAQEVYKKLLYDDSETFNIKWYGEIKAENVCQELRTLIYELEDKEANPDMRGINV